MASSINPLVPDGPTAYGADLRGNLAAAKSEIEALQAGTGLEPDSVTVDKLAWDADVNFNGRPLRNFKISDQVMASTTASAADSGRFLVYTAPATYSLPAASSLGDGFQTVVIGLGGAVTIQADVPANSVVVADGEMTTILVVQGQRLVLPPVAHTVINTGS